MTAQNKISTMVAVLRANKPLRLLLIAIVLAVLAAFMAVKYLEMREAELRLAYQQPDKKTVSVVVAAKDLPAGAMVNSENMSLRSMPLSYVHSQAVSPEQFARLQGRRMIQPIEAGRTLLWTHVAGVKRTDFSDILDLGRRAVTVPVDELSSNAGMLRAGNHIDLYVTMSAKNVGGTKGDVVLPVLQNVEVLATGTSLDPEVQATMSVAYQRNGAGYSNVTVDLTPKESALIFAAKSAGRLSAILRNRKDKGQSNFGHVQASDIISLAREVAAESAPPIKVVRDNNGKVIGVVKDDGTVVDANGNIIGRQNPNGTVVGNDGVEIGSIGQVVRDSNGNVVGTVRADGKVVDASGNIVGTQNPDGTVINNDGKQIGTVRQVVTDASGNILGTVQADGTVVDETGKIVGKRNADGSVVSNSGKVIGKVTAATLTDNDAKKLGLPTKSERNATQAAATYIVEFLSGGNSQNGIATVQKITVQ